jgi:hypothetical protein
MAKRKNSQRGAVLMRTTIGWAALAMTMQKIVKVE